MAHRYQHDYYVGMSPYLCLIFISDETTDVTMVLSTVRKQWWINTKVSNGDKQLELKCAQPARPASQWFYLESSGNQMDQYNTRRCHDRGASGSV